MHPAFLYLCAKKHYVYSLREIIDSYYPLSDEAFAKVERLTKLVHFPKKTALFEPDRYEPDLYILAKGTARVYIINEQGEEVSYILFLEKSVLLSFDGYLHQMPSYEYIELLEDSVLYHLKTEALKQLYLEDLEICNFGRILSDYFAYQTEARFIDRLSLSATERYQKLMKDNPEVLQRIPLKYIASHLGITQVSLSRIRAKYLT